MIAENKCNVVSELYNQAQGDWAKNYNSLNLH